MTRFALRKRKFN